VFRIQGRGQGIHVMTGFDPIEAITAGCAFLVLSAFLLCTAISLYRHDLARNRRLAIQGQIELHVFAETLRRG